MKVIVIEDTSNGIIGVAESEHAAVKWLVEHNWINDSCLTLDAIRIEETDTWHYPTLRETFGKNWREVVSNLSIEDFTNVYFEGQFYFYELTLITEDDD